VTPVSQRRRNVHPHRRGRKVSAPPELQPHLGSHHRRKPSPGGAITEATEKTPPKEFYFVPPQTKFTEGLYNGGSDSGVPSEYSSYALPVKEYQRKQRLHFEDDLQSADGSVEDLVDEKSRRNSENLYNSDSETESGVANSPMPQRQGLDNGAYESDEPALIMEGRPELQRQMTNTSFITNDMISNINQVNTSAQSRRDRTNSCVLQLAVGPNQIQSATMPSSRSVSLYSLNQADVNTLPNGYPSLNNFNQDNQSIYSDIGGNYQTGYLGTQNINIVGSSHGSILKDSHAPSSVSHRSDGDEPEKTLDSDKQKAFVERLSDNMSLLYAMFIVSLGFVIYLADIFSGHDSVIAECYNIYLMVAQIMVLGYLHIDIRRYCNRVAKALQANTEYKEEVNDVTLTNTDEGNIQIKISMPEHRNTIKQHYGFTSGRHGGSLYLKIGATVFCFGHLIHSGLNLGQKILYLTADDGAFENCTCMSDVIASVLQPVYAFYNLFFVYKYSNLIINKRTQFSKYGMMHCIAASLCFWIYTIMQETLQAIYAKKKKGGDFNVTTTTPYPLVSMLNLKGDDDSDEMFDDEAMEMIKKSIYSVTKYGTDEWNIHYGCEQTTELTEMINYTTPYLYPFSIEYNLLIVGVWILIYENIGKLALHTHLPSMEVEYEDSNKAKELQSNMVIYVDCHSSNRGFFFGLLMTVGTVISVILYFIFTSSQQNVYLGLQVKAYSELFLLLVMGAATLSAFNSIRHLDVLKSHVSAVDDILLIICIPCILLYAFFNMVPSMINGNSLFVIVYILQGIQAIIQTAFIGDGLRRCSNDNKLQNKKPGREVVTFLVVANVALWLLETFEIKNDAGNADKYEFYGKNLWTMISHLTLPLALFYRFHSSVCLADIWKSAYEPELDH